MSAERFTIDTDDGIFIHHPFAANMTVPQMFEGAIRQQSADLDQLRAELAAVAAERDRAIAAWNRAQQAHANDTGRLCDELDQLHARLAAIDAAPTVAIAQHVIGPDGVPYAYLSYTHEDVPAHDIELIARPAKD